MHIISPGARQHLTAGHFLDNKDGTITDTRTNLTWMRFAMGQTWDGTHCIGDPIRYTWDVASQIVFSFAGFDDWRLPSIDELKSITDPSRLDTATDPNIFPNTPSWAFWSRTCDPQVSSVAWYVNSRSGQSTTLNKGSKFLVRLVRNSGATQYDAKSLLTDQSIDESHSRRISESSPTPVTDFLTNVSSAVNIRSTHNGIDAVGLHSVEHHDDGAVKDVNTGLTWMRFLIGQEWDGTKCVGVPSIHDWHSALSMHPKFAGYDDWRLPEFDELESIVDSIKSHDPNKDGFLSTLGTPVWIYSFNPDTGSPEGAFVSNGIIKVVQAPACAVLMVRREIAPPTKARSPLLSQYLSPAVTDEIINGTVSSSRIHKIRQALAQREQNSYGDSTFKKNKLLGQGQWILQNPPAAGWGGSLSSEGVNGPYNELERLCIGLNMLIMSNCEEARLVLQEFYNGYGSIKHISDLLPENDWQAAGVSVFFNDLVGAGIAYSDKKSFENLSAKNRNDVTGSLVEEIIQPLIQSESDTLTGSKLKTKSLAKASTNPASYVLATQSSFPEKSPVNSEELSSIVSRLQLLEHGLASALQKVERLYEETSQTQSALRKVVEMLTQSSTVSSLQPTRLNSDENGDAVISEIEASLPEQVATQEVPAFREVLKWLESQSFVSFSELRSRLVPLDLLPGAVIDHLNEKALDLLGELAFEDKGEDGVIVIQAVLNQVIACWSGADEL
jgi:hypothetical protein